MTVFKTVHGDVLAAGGEIIGISVDHVPCHKGWAATFDGVPFPLLGDWMQEVAQKYDVQDPDRRIAKRTTYVVDREGVIRFVNPAMDPRSTEHYDAIMKAFNDLP